MKRRVYVDTSAYLCLLLGEEGHADVAKQLAHARKHSSVVLVLEARRNLIRLARLAKLSSARLHELLDRLRSDCELFALRELTLDLCQDPTLPAVQTPRSLDLVHLQTALWFHRRDPLHAFVTRDEAQRLAARELGLPTA